MEDRFCPEDGTYVYPDESGGFYCGLCNWISEPPELPKTPEVPPPPATSVPRAGDREKSQKTAASKPPTTSAPKPLDDSQSRRAALQSESAGVADTHRSSPPIATTPTTPGAHAAQGTPTVQSSRRPIIIGLALVVLVAAIYIIYSIVNTFPQRVDRALAAGRIFSPPGSCVFDLWTAEQAKSPASSELAAVGVKIRAVLAPKGDDAFNRWYKDSDDTVNWDEMYRTYGFLSRISPEEAQFKVRSLYATGQKELMSRNYPAALAAYDAVLTLDTCNVLALNGIGKIYMRDGSPLQNKDRAVQFYQKATTCDSNFTWAYTNLGNYYMQLDQWAAAKANMLNALRTSPGRPSILRSLGRISYNQSKYSEGLKYYQDSLQNEQNPETIASVNKSMEQIHQKMR